MGGGGKSVMQRDDPAQVPCNSPQKKSLSQST
jgi:hypothetical protein